MRKWKWWILVLVIGMIAAAAVGIIREQRKASAVLAKSYIMYDQWGVLPEGDPSDPEAIQMAIDSYDTSAVFPEPRGKGNGAQGLRLC